MKKVLLISIVFLSFVSSISFGYMEDKVFCTISKNSITITLERENNYKCMEYLNVLSQTINTEYNDVLSIQNLINQWYDIEYWKNIREEKRDKIKKMITVKNQIESAVKEFDQNLFMKIKEYVVYTVSPYKTTYKKALKNLKAVQQQWWKISNTVKKTMDYLQEDIEVIDNIINSTDYDILMKNFNRHLYLKKQIEWK